MKALRIFLEIVTILFSPVIGMIVGLRIYGHPMGIDEIIFFQYMCPGAAAGLFLSIVLVLYFRKKFSFAALSGLFVGASVGIGLGALIWFNILKPRGLEPSDPDIAVMMFDTIFFCLCALGASAGFFISRKMSRYLKNRKARWVTAYLVESFPKLRRQLFRVTCAIGLSIIPLFILFTFLYLLIIQPYIRHIEHARSINQLKQQAIKKLEADPNDIGALHWMGVHHLTRTRRYQEAEKYFRKIVDLESAEGDFSTGGQRSLIYLATIYQSWAEHDKAENYYQQFIATAPNLENDTVLISYNNRYLKKRNSQKMNEPLSAHCSVKGTSLFGRVSGALRTVVRI